MDWTVDVSKEEERTFYDFRIFSPAGQDFGFSIDIDNSEKYKFYSLLEKIYECYTNFDVSEETYLWLDDSGHGKNGAPYDMEDVLADMKWCEKSILELYDAISA